MAPIGQSQPGTWYIVAIVFIALFVLVSFGSALIVGYLFHQRKQPRNMNPHTFGSSYWMDWERAASSRSENDALTIATLEAQLSVQEEYNAEADRMIELMDRTQKHLTLQLRDECRRSEPIDSEAFQRIHDEIHKPLSPPRPSLPPLIVRSSSAPQPIAKSPGTIPILQTTKLEDIMRSNSRKSSRRLAIVVDAEHDPEALSTQVLAVGSTEDGNESDDASPSGARSRRII